MKKIILSFFLLYFTIMCNAEHLAKVQSISGVLVFSNCTPVCSYTTLGTISFSAENKSSGFVAMNGLIVPISNDPQYTEIRNGLLAQAVLANRETEGIIIKGKSATMIKFDNTLSSEEKKLARPNIRMGFSVFVDSNPIDDYQFVTTKKILSASDYLDGVIDKLIKKLPKNKNIEGVIIHYVTGGYDNAEGIKFSN